VLATLHIRTTPIVESGRTLIFPFSTIVHAVI
jgi:hypothetical protein